MVSKTKTNEHRAAQTSETTGSAPLTPGAPRPTKGMTRLVLELIRPYRGWLTIVFIAMLIETVMSLAAP